MQNYRCGPETSRLEHRAFRIDDAESFLVLNSHPDVIRFTGEPPLSSLDAAREAIAIYPDFDEVGYGRWACILKETKAVIGFCGLKYLTDLNAVDLGYRFFPEHWGKGYATEACRASVRFGFEVLELEHIIAMVLPENRASIRVLEKIGMQLEGKRELEGLLPLQYGIRRPAE